jgi:FkbM family methyltransferase
MNRVLQRLNMWLRRRRAARRLAIPFSRAATFALPRAVALVGRDAALDLPAEAGVRTAFIELLLDDCYLLRRFNQQRISTVVDIGANVGLFGLAARVAFPGATIHAYEPNPALKPYLANQAKQAHFHYFMEAVGRDAGRVQLYFSGTESILTTSRVDPAGEIPQVALRTAIERIGGSVDLLKLDCEGAEWEMLDDVPAWRSVKFVAMEYHLRPEHDRDSARRALERCGFRVVEQHHVGTYGLVFAAH